MRNPILRLLVLVLVLVLGGQTARAQAPREPLDIERFKPALTYDSFVVTEGSDVRWPLPHDPIQLGATANLSLNPLVVVADNDIVQRFVARRVGLDLFGSMTLFRGVAVGIGLPIFVLQDGDGAPNATGIGDLRIVPKVRLLDERRGLGLALLAEVRAPTHSDDGFSGGARSAVFAPKLAMDHRFPVGLRVGTNIGVLLRKTTQFENVEAGSEITYSAAAALYLGGYDGTVALGVDLHGGAGLAALDFEELPLEAQAYAQISPGPEVQIQLGPALGLVPGYGTPTLRLYAGIRWSPTTHDRDHDGIPDDKDRCPDDPEVRNGVDDLDGCPDRLSAGIVVALDPAGNEVPGVPVVFDDADGEEIRGKTGTAEALPPGEYMVTVEAPGFEPAEAVLVVPPDGDNRVEVVLTPLALVRVTVVDPDDEPIKRAQARVDEVRAAPTDRPGVLETEVDPGDHELWVRARGYVPQRIEIRVPAGATVEKTVHLEPIKIVVTDDRIEFSGTVFFAFDSARLVDESHDLLDEIALVLIEHRALRRVRVEGHTDQVGPEDYNQQLSEDRAASVMAYLIRAEVQEARLEARGFGESRPISNVDRENRRVEFVIVRGRVPGAEVEVEDDEDGP